MRAGGQVSIVDVHFEPVTRAGGQVSDRKGTIRERFYAFEEAVICQVIGCVALVVDADRDAPAEVYLSRFLNVRGVLVDVDIPR